MEALVEMGLDLIIFSFQCVTKEQYEFLRDKGSYGKLKANILDMVRLRAGVGRPFHPLP